MTVDSVGKRKTSTGGVTAKSAPTRRNLRSILGVTKNDTSSRVAFQPVNTRGKKGLVRSILIGIISLTVGILSLIWTPYDLIMTERLRMRPGLPAYDWWETPPADAVMRLYIFNYTNAAEYLAGRHKKLKVEEVGPIPFSEHVVHTDIKFNGNGTLSYTATRTVIAQDTDIDMEANITVPNLAVLGIASSMWNESLLKKMGAYLLINRLGSKPFITLSIREYLWDFSDPVVKAAKSIAPSLVPIENLGLLEQLYSNYTHRMTVYIGTENGPRMLFRTDKYNGQPGLGVWRNATCDSLQGSSEGVVYPQDLRTNDTLLYFRKAVCRVATLVYAGEREDSGLKVFKFVLPDTLHHRPADGDECFLAEGAPPLPDGLSDISPCFYNFPIASSFPHYLMADPVVSEKLDGLKPNYTRHTSFGHLEPNSGVTISAAARFQVNLVMRPIRSGFTKFRPLFNMSLPLAWVEYLQDGPPTKVLMLAYFVVVILKDYQVYFSIFLITLSLLPLYTVCIYLKSPRNKKTESGVAYSSLLNIHLSGQQATC